MLKERQLERTQVRAKLRFDYRGVGRPARFFFGMRSPQEIAAENRARQVAALRNIPVQGVEIEEINAEGEIYQIIDPLTNNEIAYAPVSLIVCADSMEDLIRFMMREEFRKVDILEPNELLLSHYDAEKILYQVGSELKSMLWLTQRDGGHTG